MIAICVDDEPILLEWLGRIVSASPDTKQVEKFTNEYEAIRFAEEHPFDVAFLDVELHEMDGIALAERLRRIDPQCGIIFCTGHADYAVKAISRIHVDGYLLKPIRAEAVQREIDRLKARQGRNEKLLSVELSGGVNVFDRQGRPIHFKRRKTEELFALLVRQNGESLSVRELCMRMWEDSRTSAYLLEKNENYLAQLFTDMRHALEQCGAQEVLKKTDEGYALRMPLIRLGDRKQEP